jgi:hypothetical protein
MSMTNKSPVCARHKLALALQGGDQMQEKMKRESNVCLNQRGGAKCRFPNRLAVFGGSECRYT